MDRHGLPLRHQNYEEAQVDRQIDRRDFLRSLGVGAGVTLTAAAGSIPVIGVAQAQEQPKGRIPDSHYRIGHMTFFTDPAAVLGDPMYKGQVRATNENNGSGGITG